MADKKLLEESTIRRFMELANIKPSEKGMLSEAMAPKSKVAGGRTATPDQEARRPVTEEEDQEKMEEAYHEEGYGSGMHEADEEGDMAGDEMGASGEGGDLEAAVQGLVSAMNDVLAAAGMSDKTVELDSDEGEEGGESEVSSDEDEADGSDDTMMEADDKEEDKKVEESEELEESIELVDDTLVEKLLQRVSARLVAEARKSRELAEGQKGWGKSGMHASSAKSKASTKGKGAGKGTPFTKSVSVKGTAGRK